MTKQDLTDFIAARQREIENLSAMRQQLVEEYPNDKARLEALDDMWRENVADVTRALTKLFFDFTPPHIQRIWDFTCEHEIGRKLKGKEKIAFRDFMSNVMAIGWAAATHPQKMLDFVVAQRGRIIEKYKPGNPKRFAPVIVADNMIHDLQASLKSETSAN